MRNYSNALYYFVHGKSAEVAADAFADVCAYNIYSSCWCVWCCSRSVVSVSESEVTHTTRKITFSYLFVQVQVVTLHIHTPTTLLVLHTTST